MQNSSKKPPYECIRCGYNTIQKARMRHHLYEKKNLCPHIKHDIELTEEIKETILQNRFYRIPKKEIKSNNPSPIETDLTTDVSEEMHYVYMIRTKEHSRHKENIYKIGKTKIKNPENNITRLMSYGKGTELVLIQQCKNSDILEKKILNQFNKNFKKYSGNEYFIGDRFHMSKLFMSVCIDSLGS